jgi:hypothetical protein
MNFTAITKLAVFVAGFLIAFSTVVACGKGSQSTATSSPASSTATTSAVAMPQKATFIVTLPTKEGEPDMVLAVSVDGDRVVAYACNDVNDEAWFFGTQKNGTMELTSIYQDRLQATFSGDALKAALTMNDSTYSGIGKQAAGPAGIYTATAGEARASWIVLSDRSVVGVLSANSKNDREVIDQINAQQQAFKDKVRQARLNRQLQQAPALNVSALTSQVNAQQVQVVQVGGTMTALPSGG